MTLDSKIAHILTAGIRAPSGENCQPWHFIVRGAEIEIHLLPERDQSAYSWGQRASYLACGAAIENMVVAAPGVGYRVTTSLFPSADDARHVATLVLSPQHPTTREPLMEAIEKRVTNRKPYAKKPLTDEARRALLALSGVEDVRVDLVEDEAGRKALGRVGSTNEEVMLGNRSLHDFFFSHVNWTKEEDDEKKVGFYVKTLELPPPARAMFKLMSSWSRMRFFKALGFPKIVAAQNGAVNAQASAMGAVLIPRTLPTDFVRAGRIVERLWLTATNLGLSLQPLTGVLFFKLRIAAGDDTVFTPADREKILTAYARAADIFKVRDEHIAFLFRVGYGEPPSAHASRFSLPESVTASDIL